MLRIQSVPSAQGAVARRYFPLHFYFRFRRDPLTQVQRLVDEFGPVVSLAIGRQPVFIVSEPSYIRDVLVTNARKFVKGRGLERSRRLLGNGLLTSEGEEHRKQRQLMQPAFHRQQIGRYAERMGVHARRAGARWDNGGVLDIGEEMSRLTLAIVADCLLGADVDAEAVAVRASLSQAMRAFSFMSMPYAELLEKLPLPPVQRFRRARARLDETVFRIIREHRNERSDDLLSMLLAAHEGVEGASQMTDTQLRDEVMTMFLAGHETTANALTWTWFLLSQHPDIEARLEAEVDQAWDARGEGPLGPADLARLPFTRQVFMESMRLYPPAWMVGRRAIEPHALGPWRVPRGAIVAMSQYVMHRDPRFYAVPDAFRPDRWTADFEAALPKFAYFPFGGGNRVCIGEHFAWMEGILLIATLARRWRFRLEGPAADVKPQPMITLRPARPLQMRAVTRV